MGKERGKRKGRGKGEHRMGEDREQREGGNEQGNWNVKNKNGRIKGTGGH